jgi:hypothetical protein
MVRRQRAVEIDKIGATVGQDGAVAAIDDFGWQDRDRSRPPEQITKAVLVRHDHRPQR